MDTAKSEGAQEARHAEDRRPSEGGQQPRLPDVGAADMEVPPAAAHAVAVSRGAFYFPKPRPAETPPASGSSRGEPGSPHEEPVSAGEGGVTEGAAGPSEAVNPAGSPSQPASASAPPSASSTVDELLGRLLQVARQTASLLEEEDPDPDRIEALLAERGKIFEKLQRAVLEEQTRVGQLQGRAPGEEEKEEGEEGGEGDEREGSSSAPTSSQGSPAGTAASADATRRREIVEEIRRLDEKCIPLARRRLAEAETRWKDARQLRRALIAYGWVDPEFGPRGGFVDVTD